jgi:hypothetical protein
MVAAMFFPFRSSKVGTYEGWLLTLFLLLSPILFVSPYVSTGGFFTSANSKLLCRNQQTVSFGIVILAWITKVDSGRT